MNVEGGRIFARAKYSVNRKIWEPCSCHDASNNQNLTFNRNIVLKLIS